MNSSDQRGNPLATMLIISAVDVLLCAFTATLALFFLGGGSSSSGDANNIGWAGTLVVISSPEKIQFATPPNSETIQAGLAFRLRSSPSRTNPTRFRVIGSAVAISQLGVIVVQEGKDGRNAQYTVRCTQPVEYAFRVVDGDTPVIPEATCEITASSSTALSQVQTKLTGFQGSIALGM
jgi:hypothetical protein